jgi:hypothetical protein
VRRSEVPHSAPENYSRDFPAAFALAHLNLAAWAIASLVAALIFLLAGFSSGVATACDFAPFWGPRFLGVGGTGITISERVSWANSSVKSAIWSLSSAALRSCAAESWSIDMVVAL